MATYRITELNKHQIINLHKEGVSNTDISDELGISVSIHHLHGPSEQEMARLIFLNDNFFIF